MVKPTETREIHVTNIFPVESIKLNTVEQLVSVQLYRLLASGQPVSIERLASEVKLPRDAVQVILEQWPGVFYDEAYCVVGYWGLALPKMSHRFEINGQVLYTWCAWDSLFIPEILGVTAQVESFCPVTGNKIRLTVAPDLVKHADPP
ncbi:MAG: organomercurial lyase, partial [Acidobacteriota bacterium]